MKKNYARSVLVSALTLSISILLTQNVSADDTSTKKPCTFCQFKKLASKTVKNVLKSDNKTKKAAILGTLSGISTAFHKHDGKENNESSTDASEEHQKSHDNTSTVEEKSETESASEMPASDSSHSNTINKDEVRATLEAVDFEEMEKIASIKSATVIQRKSDKRTMLHIVGAYCSKNLKAAEKIAKQIMETNKSAAFLRDSRNMTPLQVSEGNACKQVAQAIRSQGVTQ